METPLRTFTALALGGLLWTGCNREAAPAPYDDAALKAQVQALEGTVASLRASLGTVQATLGSQGGTLTDTNAQLARLEGSQYVDFGATLARRTAHLPLRTAVRVTLTPRELASIATIQAAAETTSAVARQPEMAEALGRNLAALDPADVSSATVRGYFIGLQSFTMDAIARQPEASALLATSSWAPVPQGTAFGSSAIEDVGRAYALAGLFEALARQPEAKAKLLAAFPFGPITNLRNEDVQLARTVAIGALLESVARQPEADFTEAVALLGTQPADLDAGLRWAQGYAVASASEAMARQPEAAEKLRGHLQALLHLTVASGP
jgi:F0F1-type ATP synthase membrane subunit c/vacuolar-type H+-ATPase subunit K